MRDRSYQGLKDATSFGLICDKSAEILGWKHTNFCQFPIRPFLAFFFLLLHVRSYANEAVTSLPVGKNQCGRHVWRSDSNISNIWT